MSMLHRTFLIMLTIVIFWTIGSTQALAKVTPDKVGGQKTPPNLSINQLEDAASAGDPDAQYALGYMYYYGKGVSQSVDTATAWIGKAAAQGQPQAIKALSLIQQINDPQAAQINTKGLAKSAFSGNKSEAPPTSAPVKDTNLNAMPETGGMPRYNTPVNANSISNAQTQGANGTQQVPPQAVTPTANQNQPAATAPQAPTATPAPNPTTNAAPVSSAAPTANPVEPVAVPPSSLNQEKLLNAPKNYFTIQLLGASRKDDVAAYLKKNGLQNKATYYRTVRNGNDWYVVVYGLYPSRPEAQAALKTLPGHIQQQGPWINSLAKVHDSIQKTTT